MTKDGLHSRIVDLIRPLFDDNQLHLVEVELRGAQNSRVLKVFADTENGITMAQITRLTRDISDLLDMNDAIPGRYRLEVSSPGADRPLRESWEFRKVIGKDLRVRYALPDGKVETAVGALVEVNEETLLLKLRKEVLSIPRGTIESARVQLKW